MMSNESKLLTAASGDALTIARRIVHDVKSPLGAILSMVELLQEVLESESPTRKELVGPIMESAEQILSLVNRVQEVLHASHGSEQPEELAPEIVASLIPNIPGLSVQTWPPVIAVPEWLRIVWRELFKNAAQHGGTQVDAGWDEVKPGLVKFWLRDNGTGLSAEREKRVFPAFESLHSETGVRGLGLSIVRRLVERMGGQPAYRRMEDGRSEFSFTLPQPQVIPSEKPVPLTLQGNENRLRRVLDAITSFVALLGTDGNILEVNAAILKPIGLKPEDLVGRPFESLWWWADFPNEQVLVREDIAKAAHGTAVRRESPAGLLEGASTFVEITVSPLCDEEGRVTHVVATARDLSERIIVEKAMTESEERFRTMANNISQFAWMANADGEVFWYNQRWFDYTGTTLPEMEGWGWKSVHHPDHIVRVVAKFASHIKSGESWEDVFPLRGTDGGYRWFLSRAIPIRNADGNILRWFGTNTDITTQLETEEALRRAAAAKDDFIAILSHELRTPLNPVLLIASEAVTRADLPDAVRADFDTIRKSIEAEARLIDDLLDMTRISRGKVSLVVSTVAIDEMLREMLPSIRSQAAAKGVQVAVPEIAMPHMSVQGDDTRLRQVFWNIIGNAIKFTPAGGKVRISAETIGDHAIIRVSDSGIGINAQELQRIFEPFQQGDHAANPRSPSSTTESFGGLGLGLYISKMLVELHDGDIAVTSAGAGGGTTFTIRIPLGNLTPAAVETGPTMAEFEARAAEPESPMRILLLEDHDATRNTLAMLLQRRGHLVSPAATIAQARALISVGEYDLLMSDIGLPDGRGDEFMASLLAEGRVLPGIALSGYGMEADVQRSRQAGFFMHLTKPVSLSELDRAMKRIPR